MSAVDEQTLALLEMLRNVTAANRETSSTGAIRLLFPETIAQVEAAMTRLADELAQLVEDYELLLRENRNLTASLDLIDESCLW